jgi:hypothetical protein
MRKLIEEMPTNKIGWLQLMGVMEDCRLTVSQ